MQQHLDALYQYRLNHTPYAPPQITDYNELPFSQMATSFEWRIRAYDVANVLRLLENRPQQTILEIGAWNGWLTHHLAQAEHQVTALSYSADNLDGLGTKHHYEVDWHAVQIDMSDSSAIEGKVDVVIINHGLHLFPNPVDYVQATMKHLNPGGLLIVLCMTFHRDPSIRATTLAEQDSRCRELANVPYMLKPSRGYMDIADLRTFNKMGLTLKRYPALWRSAVKSWLRTSAPIYRWGLHHAPAEHTQ